MDVTTLIIILLALLVFVEFAALVWCFTRMLGLYLAYVSGELLLKRELPVGVLKHLGFTNVRGRQVPVYKAE